LLGRGSTTFAGGEIREIGHWSGTNGQTERKGARFSTTSFVISFRCGVRRRQHRLSIQGSQGTKRTEEEKALKRSERAIAVAATAEESRAGGGPRNGARNGRTSAEKNARGTERTRKKRERRKGDDAEAGSARRRNGGKKEGRFRRPGRVCANPPKTAIKPCKRSEAHQGMH